MRVGAVRTLHGRTFANSRARRLSQPSSPRWQTLLSDKPASGARDDHLSPGATHFYTILAEDRHGDWHRVAKLKMTVDDPRLERRAEADFEAGGSRPGSQNPHALDIENSGGTPR